MNRVDKSRDMTGGAAMWVQSFPFVSFFIFVLGWFTVPIEVFFRKDFGQRWFTVLKFFAGLMVLMVFAVVQFLYHGIVHFFEKLVHQLNPLNWGDSLPEPSSYEEMTDHSMYYLMLAYIVMSAYHFFRIWWRNRTHTQLHSFDDGHSRFERIGNYFMLTVNFAAVPVLYFFMLFLPRSEWKRKIGVPWLITNLTGFTNAVVEPIIILYLSLCFHGMIKLWLLISVPALIIYSSWKETAKLNKALDFQDSVIEAETMQKQRQQEREAAQAKVTKQAETMVKHYGGPLNLTPLTPQHPDLHKIITKMNKERKLTAKDH